MIAAFTVEIANEIPADATDWNAYRPFKFLCGSVVTRWENSNETVRGEPFLDPYALLEYVAGGIRMDDDWFSWNGVGFGLPVLLDSTGWDKATKQTALDHYDVMFDFFARHGYAIGLPSVANAVGFGDETEWLKQQELRLPEWRTGADRDGLFEYSRRKTELLLKVVLRIREDGGITWFNRSGKRKMEVLDHILNVKEAMELPEPDVSWLPDPWPRSKFTGWMKE